jgi:hypothetical protein
MPGLLALNLLYLWLLLRPGRRSAFAAGVVGSLALVMHNPLPHALMAVPCLLWLAGARDRRHRLPFVIAGYAPLALLLGLGWPMLTSSLHMARAYASGEHVGFVQEWVARVGRIFTLPSQDLMESRRIATWKIWIWACPGLALAPFVLRPRGAAQGLLLAAFVLTYSAFFLVPFDQGHGWGYRYVHPAWGVLPIAGGIWFARPGAARSFGAIAVAAGLLATPVFLWQTHATIAGALALRISPPAEGRWIVFVTLDQRYAQDLVQNLPGRDRVRVLVSLGAASDRALMAAQFPQAAEVVHDDRGSAWRLTAPAR